MSTIKIKGIARIEDKATSCKGEIKILSTDTVHQKAYVSWGMFDQHGTRLAGVSSDYFMGKAAFTDKEVFDLVLEKIRSYRMGRGQLFSEVEIG